MTTDLLPIGPHDHPEPRTMMWTQVELAAIREYAARCVAAETEALREEIELDNKRIAQLERVLKSVPECPDHGDLCIPHAIGWIAKARQDQAAIDAAVAAERERCAQWVRDNYQDHPSIDSLCAAMSCAPSTEVGQTNAYASRSAAAEHARIVKRLRDEATYACACADDANLTNELADILVAEGVGGHSASYTAPAGEKT